ncbi:sensor histidine kinase [Chitinibacteraceae bacterium HSL-7]
MKLSLRTGIIVAILTGLLVPALIAGHLRLSAQQDAVTETQRRDLARAVEILALGLQEPLWNLSPEAGRPLLDSVMRDDRIVRIDVTDGNDAIFLSSNRPERRHGNVNRQSAIVNKNGGEIGRVSVEFDDSHATEAIANARRELAIGLMMQLGVSLLLILLLVQARIWRPLITLQRQATSLAELQLDTPFEWPVSDELGRLGTKLERTRLVVRDLIDTLEQKNLQLEAELLSRRQIESALRATKERQQRLLELPHIIPWEANPAEWRFTWVGSQAAALLGYHPSNWQQDDFLGQYLHPDDRHLVYSMFAQPQDASRVDLELRFVTADDRIVWLQLVGDVRQDEERMLIGGFMLDISPRKAAEAALSQYRSELELEVDRLSRTSTLQRHQLDAITTMVSRELRTPVRTLGGYLSLLKDPAKLEGGELQGYIAQATHATITLGLQLDDLQTLLHYTQVEPQPQGIDLTTIAHDIVDQLASLDPTRSARVEIESPLLAYGDPNLMQIVLHNLLDNAWKYADDDKPELHIGRSDLPTGGYAFFVRDNGKGFDASEADALFAPLRTRNQPRDGTGMGLAIARTIIERHGGHIWTGTSQGTTFYFTLPERRQG